MGSWSDSPGVPVARGFGLAAILISLIVGGLGRAVPAAAQTVEQQIASVDARIEAARAADLHVISPSHFDRAAEQLTAARARYERGGRIQDIQALLAAAGEQLGEAERLEPVGAVLLRAALEARADALAANAPEYAPELWADAESEVRDAGREVEDGDQNDARENAAQAEAMYRQAELNAIRRDVLGRAERLRSQAMRVEADELAPRTFALADSLARQAERILRDDRYERSTATELAESAGEQFEHALRIAGVVNDVREERLAVEELMLRQEREVGRVVEALGFEASLATGIAPVTEQILTTIRSLQEDRENLQRELAGRAEEINVLQTRIDSMDARLAQLEQRGARMTAELQERERQQEKLREVRAIFDDDEAEVLSRGNELMVRMYSLTFPSGSAVILPENFSLLTKLQRIIREFPDAPITVIGHTDSQGNADYNQALSEQRAMAVRDYLLANMAMSADRISSRGYGESQPIASNDSEAGRVRNRRIEVMLRLPG